MKKLIAVILTLIMVLSMVACTAQTAAPTESTEAEANTEAPAVTEEPAATVDLSTPVTLNLLSHTYAALTYYTGELVEDAPENVTVVPEMTNYTDWQEKMRLNLAQGSDAYDITYITPQDLAEFASKGWLVPLDDYIQKYWDEYNFSDIPQYLWDAYTYEGHIYGIPSHQWAMDLFYRTDLLEEAGVTVPETLDELVAAAAALNKDGRSGIVLTLKASDMLMVTYQAFLTACGGWFWDENYEPQFSGEASLKAIDYIMQLYAYTPTDSSTYTNNEATVAMCQDLAAMAMMQTTRSTNMSNPDESIVVGKVGFTSAPSLTVGGPAAAIWNTAGYSISAFSKIDPEISFLTIANATDEESSVGGADVSMPARASALTDELLATRTDYAAAWKAIQSGATLRPTIPEFSEIMEISMTALAKVITGQEEAAAAMQQVDTDVRAVLDEAGYYTK